METNFAYKGIFFSFLIISIFLGDSLQSAPKIPDSNFSRIQVDVNIAKNGQKFGYFQTSAFSYTFQWAFIFTINRGLGRDVRNSDFKKWLKNITTLPEIRDGDHWLTNFVGHPLQGATIFAFYKNRGYSNKASFAGTLLQSTLFEYTVEGWKQPPSGVDLIVTPVLGSLIGWRIGMNSIILASTYAVTKYIFGLF